MRSKKNLTSIIILFIILLIALTYYVISMKEMSTDQIAYRAAQKITSSQDLYQVGFGERMIDNTQELSLTFQGFREVSLNEARKIIIYAVKTFVDEINSSKKKEPYLTAKNVEVCIWFYKNPDYNSVSPEYIMLVEINDGVIKYYPGRPAYNIKEPLLVESYKKAIDMLSIVDNHS